MKNANDPQLRALRERAGRMRLPPLSRGRSPGASPGTTASSDSR